MDLAAIAAAFGVRLRERLAREASDTGEDDPAALLEALGVTDAAFNRAVIVAAKQFAFGKGELLMLFSVAHAIGEGAGLRRAKLTISDPRAKGREVEVIDALIAGDDIEDALRRLAPTQGAADGAVVPFRRKENQ